jgi:hypothetical protein
MKDSESDPKSEPNTKTNTDPDPKGSSTIHPENTGFHPENLVFHPENQPSNVTETECNATSNYAVEDFGSLQEQASCAPKEYQPNQNSQQVKSSLSTPAQSDNSAKSRTAAKGKGSAALPKKKKPVTADEIYAALDEAGMLNTFTIFWGWYCSDVCSISGAPPGGKAKAGSAWLDLIECDFFGVGLDGFRAGCQLAIAQFKTARGIGIQHACRFLNGGESREPNWLVLLRDQNREVKSDFLTGEARSQSKQFNPSVIAELAEMGLTPEEAFKHV